MGNCMERYRCGQKVEIKQEQQEKAGGFVKDNGGGSGGIRIKVVLTREELELLLLQLQNKGGKRIEDVLEEIERGREKVAGWKPSLESIMESPEVPEMDR